MLDENEFIHSAVIDTQNTIKMIDAKIGMLMTLQLLPLAKIWFIVEYFKLFQHNFNTLWSYLIIVSIFILWGLSIAIALMGLCAIDDPAVHVGGSKDCNGSYYRGGLFSGLGLIDAISNKKNRHSIETIDEMLESIPGKGLEIKKSLLFEHAKLVYIRSIKLNRLKWSVRTICGCTLLSLLSYFLYGVYFLPSGK